MESVREQLIMIISYTAHDPIEDTERDGNDEGEWDRRQVTLWVPMIWGETS